MSLFWYNRNRMCFHLTFVVDLLVLCCGGPCNSLLDGSYLGHIDCTPLILVEGFRLVNFYLLFSLFVEVLNILGLLKLAKVKLHSGRNKEGNGFYSVEKPGLVYWILCCIYLRNLEFMYDLDEKIYTFSAKTIGKATRVLLLLLEFIILYYDNIMR